MPKPTAFENWLLIAILAAVLGFTVVPILWGHFTRSSLQTNGVAAKATVLEILDTGRRHNSNPVVLLKLDVRLPGGERRLAEITMPMSAVRIAALPPRTEVDVRVDPEDASNVALAAD